MITGRCRYAQKQKQNNKHSENVTALVELKATRITVRAVFTRADWPCIYARIIICCFLPLIFMTACSLTLMVPFTHRFSTLGPIE